MSRILVYISPARGHIFPLVPTLQALARRGHQIHARCLAAEVERLTALGFQAAPLDPTVEGRELDDWKAETPPEALVRAVTTFVDRAPAEIRDLNAAIAAIQPDGLFIDINTWGASAAAEASGRPWAAFAPYFLPIPGPGIPPWGLGLAPATGPEVEPRDQFLWAFVAGLLDQVRAPLNAIRQQAGARPFAHVIEYATAAPHLLYYTAEPFEYPRRPWPANVRLVGPGIWEPDSGTIPDLELGDRPLVLATCSTEFQNDRALAECTLAGLADEPVAVVVTTAASNPAGLTIPANARVARFLPHGLLLKFAACVICHGGMGITQKALAAGVPLCVAPFGRDQYEVARHVAVAGAGVCLPAPELTPERLRQAVREALEMRPGARRIAAAFQAAGGAETAADALEEGMRRPRP
ncbi:MAG: glycosyltransferase [Candidatus Competibacteraceae bacterium]